MSNLTGPTQFLVTRGDWATISFKHCISWTSFDQSSVRSSQKIAQLLSCKLSLKIILLKLLAYFNYCHISQGSMSHKLVQCQCGCCYNMVNIFLNTHNKRLMSRCHGWDMGCLLWVQKSMFYLSDCIFIQTPQNLVVSGHKLIKNE